MKKIDTNSKGYKRFSKAVWWTAYSGGVLSVDCVVIPFIEAVFGEKMRFFKYVSKFGLVGLSMVLGVDAANAMAACQEAAVDSWNHLVDIHENKVISKTYPVPGVRIPQNPTRDIHDDIAEIRLFEFADEETAKLVCEKCAQWFEHHSSLTVDEFDGIRWLVDHNHIVSVITDGKLYGWTEFHGEIEKIDDNNYYLDLGTYDILPDQVNYFKSSAMKAEELKNNDIKED